MRYLQYLLSIDYFALPGEPKQDKSDWIASLTSVSGCLNGSVGAHASGVDDKFYLRSDKSQKLKYIETLAADALAAGTKYVACLSNVIEPAGTQEIEPENVVKVFKQRPQSTLRSILVDKRNDSNQDIMYEFLFIQRQAQ